MLKKDNFFFGFTIALMVTLGVYGLLFLIKIPLESLIKWFRISDGTMVTTGLSINLLVINYYLNHKKNNTARGIMVLFLVGAAFVVYKFYLDN